MSKVVGSLREAISAAGLRDGMTVSFHHHLRSGDYVINMVMNEIAAMGIKNLTVNASSLFDENNHGLYVRGAWQVHFRRNYGAAGGIYDPRRATHRHYAG